MIDRDAIKNSKFYKVVFHESELTDEEKLCYSNREKEAIETFYQIYDYIDLLNHIENEKEVINDVRNYLLNLYEDFWMSGKRCYFRKPMKNDLTIAQYNSLPIRYQYSVSNDMERIIFFKYPIKALLFYFLDYMTETCILILEDANVKLIDFQEEPKIKFTFSTIEALYTHQLFKKKPLIYDIGVFSSICADLYYPHKSFWYVFNQLSNIKNYGGKKIFIKLIIKQI